MASMEPDEREEYADEDIFSNKDEPPPRISFLSHIILVIIASAGLGLGLIRIALDMGGDLSRAKILYILPLALVLVGLAQVSSAYSLVKYKLGSGDYLGALEAARKIKYRYLMVSVIAWGFALASGR